MHITIPNNSNNTQGGLESYVIQLKEDVDEKVHTVMDFCFLEAYFMPTVAFLYEDIGTWSGRLAVNKDSKNLLAITLSMNERKTHISWRTEGLPFDCGRLAPVPQPRAGMYIYIYI